MALRTDPSFDRAFQVKLDAAIARFFERVSVQLAASTERLRQRAGVMERFLSDAESRADRAAIEAEAATQNVLEQLRGRQLSKRQLAVLAQQISARLGDVEIAIQEARGACDSAAYNVEQWIRRVAVADEHDVPDLAEQATVRVEEWKSAVKETQTTLREYLQLQNQLRQLGHVVLECAAAR